MHPLGSHIWGFCTCHGPEGSEVAHKDHGYGQKVTCSVSHSRDPAGCCPRRCAMLWFVAATWSPAGWTQVGPRHLEAPSRLGSAVLSWVQLTMDSLMGHSVNGSDTGSNAAYLPLKPTEAVKISSLLGERCAGVSSSLRGSADVTPEPRHVRKVQEPAAVAFSPTPHLLYLSNLYVIQNV